MGCVADSQLLLSRYGIGERLEMSAREVLEQNVSAARHKIGSRPYISLSLFVIIVVLVALLGYARYQYVQAELAAQQNVLNRIQGELTNWSDDLSMRLRELKDGVQGTTQGAGNLVGGVWGIASFVVTAILDIAGNSAYHDPCDHYLLRYRFLRHAQNETRDSHCFVDRNLGFDDDRYCPGKRHWAAGDCRTLVLEQDRPALVNCYSRLTRKAEIPYSTGARGFQWAPTGRAGAN